jgi:hypothetical protein
MTADEVGPTHGRHHDTPHSLEHLIGRHRHATPAAALEAVNINFQQDRREPARM